MTTVVLWRHGRTAWNAVNRFQGHSDIDLDDLGRAQARRAAEVLSSLPVDTIVSSDLRRAVDTATVLGEVTGLPVTIDAGLREARAGSWEGLTHHEIAEQDPELFRAWKRDGSIRPGSTGETRAEVGHRVAAALRHLVLVGPASHDNVIVACTHGGSARAAIGELLGWPVSAWGSLRVLNNCAWAALRVDREQRWQLLGYNLTTSPALP